MSGPTPGGPLRPIACRAASLTLFALLGTACIEGGSSTEDPVDAAPPGRLADVMADVGVDGMMADATRDALADAGVDAMVGPMGADGRDNDGDGRIDFPDDPQCASARGGEGEPG